MIISRADSTNNFKGIHIATARPRIDGASNTFKLYKLTSSDADFLNNLKTNTNLDELMPKLSRIELDVWNSVFRDAVSSAAYKSNTSFLIASDNKPCGLAVSRRGYYKCYQLNQICTFPVEQGKRVPLAGKTLFRPIFDDFLNSGCRLMELVALKYGPFYPMSKYLNLGFGMYGGNDASELMRITPQKVLKTLEHLNELISYKPVSESVAKNVDLFSELICKK